MMKVRLHKITCKKTKMIARIEAGEAVRQSTTGTTTAILICGAIASDQKDVAAKEPKFACAEVGTCNCDCSIALAQEKMDIDGKHINMHVGELKFVSASFTNKGIYVASANVRESRWAFVEKSAARLCEERYWYFG